MNLSGILVVTKPDHHIQVVEALKAMEGMEVHQVDVSTGRVIAVQEATDIHAEVEGLKRVKAIPNVIMAEMVFHYIAEDQRIYESIPSDLEDDQSGLGAHGAETCVVPAYLNS